MRIIESVLFISPILCGLDKKEWRSLSDQITLSCVREVGRGFLYSQKKQESLAEVAPFKFFILSEEIIPFSFSNGKMR